MAVSDIEAVLEFLRNNGFSDTESSLMEDILEKPELGSAAVQKFVFPMVPAPPPVKIPATRKKPAAEEEKGLSELVDSSSDSSDEFVSMASSTTDLYSSDFTNPYGICTKTGASSHASSDRLSQFGTARDYHEFDMLNNDINWYKEKQEDYPMPNCPTEDKFVMTFEMQNRSEDELDLKTMSERLQSIGKLNHSDNFWPFDSLDKVKDGVQVKDYYKFDGSVHIDGGFKNIRENGMDYFQIEAAEDRPKECVLALEYETDKNYTYGDFESTNILHNPVVEKGSYENINGNYEANDDKGVHRESGEHDTAGDEEGGTTGDELIHITNEEDYEVFNLRIIHRKKRTGFEENKDLPIVINSIIAGRYYVTEYLGSATFSKVVQAHDLLMGVDVCLKIIKNDKDFFDQSLDEIKLLKFVNKHDPGDERHILRLYDYFYHQEHLFIVCELLRANLYEFQKYNRESGGEPYFTMNRLQVITRQCLEALDYLHDLGIIHCDLKPENILIKSYRKCEIKVIDLGSSCFQTDNLSLYIQSRSYRAPEVILGHSYDQKIDLWSLGCILAELYSGEVLFPNDAIVTLLSRMIGILGPIDMEMLVGGQETDKYFTNEYDLYHINEETNQLEYIIPEKSSLENHLQVSDVGFVDFLRELLEINPLRRLSAKEALKHPWLSYSYDAEFPTD